MGNKKHIDRLFQEKFKDFEVNPDPKIWENIQNEIALKEEEKKRVIPIWFKYGGIAAMLLLFLTVGITTFKSISNTTNTIVDTKTPIIDNAKNDKTTKNQNTISNNTTIVSTNNDNSIKLNKANTKTPITDNDKTTKDQNTISNTPIVSTNNNNNIKLNNTESKPASNENEVKTPINKQTSIASTSVKAEKKATKNKKIITPNKSTINNTAVANITPFSKNLNNSLTYKTKDKKNIAETKNSISKNKINETNSLNSATAISNTNIQKTVNKEEDINNAINAVKDDTFSSIVAQDQSSNKKNTPNEIIKDSTATNSIENAIAEAKEESKKEKNKKDPSPNNKWFVSANVAPVYYSSLGKGSHIDQQFIDNDKTGAVNTSYGINVGYAITDKLKVRSGINSLNLGYDTNNVVVYKSVSNSGRDPNALNNLDMSSFGASGIEIAIISGENINTNQVESFFAQDEFETASLKQQINYIEVPVELEYALVNKRFGVNVIGGMSTFILGGNAVSTELRGTTTQIGEANNINEISFSTNIGLGVNYNFSKAFKINLEPTFKYQLDAFDDTSGNFNPFILGVYTGLSYKF